MALYFEPGLLAVRHVCCCNAEASVSDADLNFFSDETGVSQGDYTTHDICAEQERSEHASAQIDPSLHVRFGLSLPSNLPGA